MKSKEEILNKIIQDLPMQEFRGKMTDYEWYGWFEEAFNKGYAQALQLQQTGVMCSLCDGNGYTIEVEAECCRNFNDYGCCGVPDPVQVQKQCYCSGGELPI